MILHCKNDLGLISVTFDGIQIMLTDEPSILIFDQLQKYLHNYKEFLDLDYFDLDCLTGVCSVFASSEVRDFLPSYTCAVRLVFKEASMLCKLYNLFAPKRKQVVFDSGLNHFHNCKISDEMLGRCETP